MIQIRRVPSFIGWANWARKKITTCKGSKNTVRIQPLSYFHKWKFCYIDKNKILITDTIFFLCSISGTKNFRIYQRETKLRCKGSPSWWYWQSLQRILCSQERWETSESIPMLSFNHSRSNSWNAFHLNWENSFHSDRPLNLASPKGGSTRVPYKVIEAKSPQYTVVYQIENATQRYLDILKVKKIKFVHSAGVDPHKEDKECFSAGKFIQSRWEIYWCCYWWWFWFLVHGFCQLREVIQISSACNSGAEMMCVVL